MTDTMAVARMMHAHHRDVGRAQALLRHGRQMAGKMGLRARASGLAYVEDLEHGVARACEARDATWREYMRQFLAEQGDQ